MKPNRFVARRLLAALVLSASLPTLAFAQAYPNRPIKLVLPFPAGSATDGASRVIAEEVRKSLGQAIVVDNQAGADGILAAQAVKRAPPDGYTLLVSTNSAHGSNPSLHQQLPYDPQKDFEPVAGLIRIPLVLAVRRDFPADDLAGFIKVATQRAATKSLSYGTGNTSNRVGAELLKSAAKLDMVEVPYRGTPQALQDLVAGQIDVMAVDPFSAMGFITGGQLKVLSVMDLGRHPLLPNVPTMIEAGFKDTQVVTWAAVFAPAKTDPAIVDRLNREINAALAKPSVKEAIQKMAMSPMPMTPGELRTFVGAEIKRWGRLVELAGIPKK